MRIAKRMANLLQQEKVTLYITAIFICWVEKITIL